MFFFLGGWIALLMPVVNYMRYDQGVAAILDGFLPFAADNGWSTIQQMSFVPVFGIAMGGSVGLSLWAARPLLPALLRRRVVWRPAEGPLSTATLRDGIGYFLLIAFLWTVLTLSIALLSVM